LLFILSCSEGLFLFLLAFEIIFIAENVIIILLLELVFL
jgi:hypothetical protein